MGPGHDLPVGILVQALPGFGVEGSRFPRLLFSSDAYRRHRTLEDRVASHEEAFRTRTSRPARHPVGLRVDAVAFHPVRLVRLRYGDGDASLPKGSVPFAAALHVRGLVLLPDLDRQRPGLVGQGGPVHSPAVCRAGATGRSRLPAVPEDPQGVRAQLRADSPDSRTPGATRELPCPEGVHQTTQSLCRSLELRSGVVPEEMA